MKNKDYDIEKIKKEIAERVQRQAKYEFKQRQKLFLSKCLTVRG